MFDECLIRLQTLTFATIDYQRIEPFPTEVRFRTPDPREDFGHYDVRFVLRFGEGAGDVFQVQIAFTRTMLEDLPDKAISHSIRQALMDLGAKAVGQMHGAE